LSDYYTLLGSSDKSGRFWYGPPLGLGSLQQRGHCLRCMEMAKEPSHEVVDKEVAYRIGVEEAAANKLSQDELRVVYQMTPSLKPSQYLANK